MTSRIAVFLIAIVCMLMTSYVQADSRVTVHDFYGPNASRVREDVVNLLERQSGVTIVPKDEIESAARKLKVDPYSPDGRKAVSRELQVSAWMTGTVQRKAGKLTLTVMVYDGAQHERVGKAQLSGRTAGKLSSEIKGRLWRKSRRAILSAAAPSGGDETIVANAKSETEAKSTTLTASSRSGRNGTRDEAENASEGETVRGQSDALRAFIGLGSPYRSLSYSEPVTSTLGDYKLNGAPMVDLNVLFFPARLATDSWLSWLGLDLRAQLALSTTARDGDGNQFNSSYNAFHVGARVRVPVGAHALSAFSGYAMNRFSISPQGENRGAAAPSVDYRSMRTGVGAEFALSNSFRLGMDAAYLNFLSVGDIGRWFPRTTAGGIELGLAATWFMSDAFFARASASYQRNFFDFNSRPGDQYIAGGALDQYLAASIGAGVSL